MRQASGWRIAVGTALVALALACPTPEARAEGGFFDFLFGKSADAPPPRPAPPRERPRVRPQAPAAQPPGARKDAARRSPAITTAQKPDVVVAVFGDAFAVSVARGLADTETTDGVRQVLDRSTDDAGMTTTEAAAWDKAIDEARSQAGRLDVAIVMLGINDGGALTDPQGQKQVPGSPGWRQLYGDRVARLADRFRDKHVPLIWVGLPIVRDADQARTYAAINEVVGERATREGARFADVWPSFADENGDFSTTGPDVNGRPATLRWTNGWNFTRAGAKKLASFVVPDLKRLRDRARSTAELAALPAQNVDVFDQALNIDVNAQILREAGLPVPSAATPARTQPGPVLVLTGAPVANDGLLAEIRPAPATAPGGGIHLGRADDFSWPRR